MNEWLIYTLISLALALLFFWLMRRQQYVYQRRWLLHKIQQEPQQKNHYATALSELKTNSGQVFKVTVLIVILVVPISLFVNYSLFNNKEAPQQQSPLSIEEALAQLEENLESNPNDLESQLLYARAMMSTQQFEAAVKAYQKAHNLAPEDANILTDLAEATAFKNNTGSFLGQPEVYLQQALALNPKQQKAMWLQGIIEFEKNNYATAESIWTQLMEQIDEPKVNVTIIKQINQARAAQNKEPLENDAKTTDNPIADTITYRITVDADAALKDKEFPTTTRLFIAAKAPSGPPMPVAAMAVAPPFKWPLTVSLSNQHNLTPNRSISDLSEIQLSVKLSISGDAGSSDYLAKDQLASPESTTVKFTLSDKNNPL